jgi:hypothetical protein
LRTLLRIGKNGIRLRDLLEAFFGTGLFVAVGMVFECELAEGSPNCLLIRVVRDAENLVVILLGRRSDASPSRPASGLP